MDSRLYRQVFGDLPQRRSVSHSCIPCYNLAAPSIIKEVSKNFSFESKTKSISDSSIVFPFFQNFRYETDFCTVLHPGSGLVDRASKLVADKLLWEKKLTNLTPKDCNKAITSLKLAKEYAVTDLNLSLEKYLKHFKNDPEPYFKGDYNWLYSGGNITGFSFGSAHYLIIPNEIKNSMVLNFTKLDADFKEIDEENREQKLFFLQDNDPVFQICCSNEMDNLFFLTRQRQKITLVRIDDSFGRDFCTHKIDYGIFICSDLSTQSRVVATLDSFFEVNIFDIENGQKTVFHEGKSKSQSWAQIMFNSNGTGLYFADQHSFNMIDLRVASSSNLLYELMPTPHDCEVICNVIKRKYLDNTFLIATAHNLLEIDIRNKKISQRWTHLMTSPPQFGKTSFRNGEEIIVLQSENPDEMVGIINESENSDIQFVSKSNPLLFDNIRREYNKAQLDGVCTYPGTRERLDFAITGLEILDVFANLNDGPHILTINGGCDVMLNKLKKVRSEKHGREYRDISEISVKGLMVFEDHCLKTYSEEMTADEFFDMSRLIEVLEEEKLEGKDLKPRKAYWHMAEMYSPESLCYFKDFMAERILDVWDVRMRNLWDGDEEVQEDGNFYEQFGVSKVVQWMENNQGQ